MRELGTRRIPPAELARIAERASARYGWPLHVVEQPQAFGRALLAALGGP